MASLVIHNSLRFVLFAAYHCLNNVSRDEYWYNSMKQQPNYIGDMSVIKFDAVQCWLGTLARVK